MTVLLKTLGTVFGPVFGPAFRMIATARLQLTLEIGTVCLPDTLRGSIHFFHGDSLLE